MLNYLLCLEFVHKDPFFHFTKGTVVNRFSDFRYTLMTSVLMRVFCKEIVLISTY